MRAVYISVGHYDDLMVAQLFDVEFVATDAGAKRHNQIANFLAGQHLVETRALDVQDLTAQGQNGLCATIPSGLRRSASRVTLDQKDFGFGCIFFRAVFQLTRKEVDIHRSFTARQFSGFSGRFSCQRGLNDLANNHFGNSWVFLKPFT